MMFDAVRQWWRSPSIFEVNHLFSRTLSQCVAEREAIEIEELAEERGTGASEPPPPASRDSGPDVLDGVSLGAHP